MALPEISSKRKRKHSSTPLPKKDDLDGFARKGVMYIGHLPHGFYEEGLRGFFGQFGKVTRVKVARNPQTLSARGHAYVEFKYEAIAKVAAETMDSYIMYNKALRCKFTPPEKVPRHFEFDHVKLPLPHVQAVRAHNSAKTTKTQQDNARHAIQRYTAKKRKLAELGINYELKDYEDAIKRSKERTQSRETSTKDLNKLSLTVKKPLVRKTLAKSPNNPTKNLKKGEVRMRMAMNARRMHMAKKNKLIQNNKAAFLRNRATLKRKKNLKKTGLKRKLHLKKNGKKMR